MRKTVLSLSLIFLWIAGISQSEQFLERYNKLVFDLYKMVLTQHSNQVFSPYFVVQNFAPIYMGSRGRTHAEIGYFFGFDEDMNKFAEQVELFKQIAHRDNNLSTRIESFVGIVMEDSLKKRINPDFLKAIDSFLVDSIVFTDLHSGIADVTYDLNRFISHSAINLLPAPVFDNPEQFKGGILLISSAIFNGSWEKNFNQLYMAPFYLDNYGRKTKSLLYMTVNAYFKYVEGPNYKVVEIPYENNRLSLMIILPNEGVDLYQLQKQINYDDYSLVAKGLALQRLRIFLPVLEVQSFYALKDTLKTYMPSLFRRGANLTGMIKKLVWVDQVYHAVQFKIEPESELPFQRFIDLQSEAQLSKILFINRPFIFFVRDNSTGAILFLGHVYKPI